MESTLGLLATPVPPGLVDGLITRIGEIEMVEAETGGGELAEECRSFIRSKGTKVEWMDIFTVAHAINGGVLLRESAPPTRPSRAGTTHQRKPPKVSAEISAPADAEGELTKQEIFDIESMVKSMGLDVTTPEA